MDVVMSLQETLKFYKSVFNKIEKQKDGTIFEDGMYSLTSIKSEADKHLFALELKEVYGYDIKRKHVNREYEQLNDFICINRANEHKSIISEDGTRPENGEILLQISFPTGAYIFGGDYPREFFYKFINELKTYNPKYIDSMNHYLYFDLTNGAKIFNEFNDVFNRYKDLNKKDLILREIERKNKEIENLKKEFEK